MVIIFVSSRRLPLSLDVADDGYLTIPGLSPFASVFGAELEYTSTKRKGVPIKSKLCLVTFTTLTSSLPCASAFCTLELLRTSTRHLRRKCSRFPKGLTRKHKHETQIAKHSLWQGGRPSNQLRTRLARKYKRGRQTNKALSKGRLEQSVILQEDVSTNPVGSAAVPSSISIMAACRKLSVTNMFILSAHHHTVVSPRETKPSKQSRFTFVREFTFLQSDFLLNLFVKVEKSHVLYIYSLRGRDDSLQ